VCVCNILEIILFITFPILVFLLLAFDSSTFFLLLVFGLTGFTEYELSCYYLIKYQLYKYKIMFYIYYDIYTQTIK